jgi:hypothetical protein
VAEALAYVREQRASDTPFDLAMSGESPQDADAARAQVRPFAEAGATWWIEEGLGWSLDEFRARIQAGPPRVQPTLALFRLIDAIYPTALTPVRSSGSRILRLIFDKLFRDRDANLAGRRGRWLVALIALALGVFRAVTPTSTEQKGSLSHKLTRGSPGPYNSRVCPDPDKAGAPGRFAHPPTA